MRLSDEKSQKRLHEYCLDVIAELLIKMAKYLKNNFGGDDCQICIVLSFGVICPTHYLILKNKTLLFFLNRCKKGACEKITELFVEHLQTHIACVGALGVFYKVVFFSEPLLQHLRKHCGCEQLLELYEECAQKYLRVARSSDERN